MKRPLLLLAVALSACAFAQQGKPAIPGMSLETTSYAAYAGNRKIWEIHADKVEGNRKQAKVSQIHGTLFRNGTPVYTLTSPLAYLNITTNDLFFPDGVLLLKSNGERIWTQALNWEARKKEFVGSKGVKIVSLNTRIRGDNMILRPGFNHILLTGHTKAVIAR